MKASVVLFLAAEVAHRGRDRSATPSSSSGRGRSSPRATVVVGTLVHGATARVVLAALLVAACVLFAVELGLFFLPAAAALLGAAVSDQQHQATITGSSTEGAEALSGDRRTRDHARDAAGGARSRGRGAAPARRAPGARAGSGPGAPAGAGLRRLPHRPAHPRGRAAAAPLARRARPPDRRRGRGARTGRRVRRAGRRAGRAAARSWATASACRGCTRPTRPAASAAAGRRTSASTRCSPAGTSTAASPSTRWRRPGSSTVCRPA